MKQKYTQAKRARRLFIPPTSFVHTAPVWLRRFHDIIGADHKAFDKKHPRIARAVEGLKARARVQKESVA